MAVAAYMLPEPQFEFLISLLFRFGIEVRADYLVGGVFDSPYLVSGRCIVKRCGVSECADVLRLFFCLGEVVLEFDVFGFGGKGNEVVYQQIEVLHDLLLRFVLHQSVIVAKKQVKSK